MNDFAVVSAFEAAVAEFFDAPYAVATDSCTHAMELCLRHLNVKRIAVPARTYVSIPMLAHKLGVPLYFTNTEWSSSYLIEPSQDFVYDAVTFWQRGGYRNGTLMCLSFQFQKHLALGRGGMILTDELYRKHTFERMAYDGRYRSIPWRRQNITTIGYHYYMTPETAALGLAKLPEAIRTEPRIWSSADYPDLRGMAVFQQTDPTDPTDPPETPRGSE
jgi:dTDP-4-amino-4,6-dideoxygalactose transaminase